MSTLPSRLAIVGTAGHIDHGKTALVRRLTGVDTDRLPEEKKRGISIDLGFAPLTTPAGVRVGLVDVPGHERFVKNMLAGVGGMDLVLLVIAADEGVMPQTREHLAIVQLLGVPRGIVVLTKRDLVDDDWLALVTREVRELLAPGPLAGAPVVAVSSTTGAGVPALLATLDAQLAEVAARHADEPARLPVDRVFTVEGFGTVVTGTLWRGRIRTGDALELAPGERAVRVRRVQVHGETVDEALAGQRTAVALHGVEREQVARGHWLQGPASLRASRLLDVRFELLPDAPRALRADTRVRFHLGAAELIGRLVLLEGEGLEPGGRALAQVRLEQATAAARGDRFVVRQYSPSRTIGGGVVIDPAAERRRRRDVAGLATLEVHESGSLEARLEERLAAATRPVAAEALAQEVGEALPLVQAALARMEAAGSVVQAVPGRWIGDDHWGEAREAIEAVVRDYAERHPARYGVMKGELKSGLKARIETALYDAAYDALVREGVLQQRGERVRPAGAEWVPPTEVAALLVRLEALLEAEGFAVPENDKWKAALGAGATEAASLGFFLERLVRVNTEFTYTAAQMTRMRAVLGEWFAGHGTLTVSEFRGITGASRKFAVPLLEHADRLGWTVRVGDERKAGGR
jgi:selenocysteine-specific elongation factor